MLTTLTQIGGTPSAIDLLSRRYPKPTNAVALAATLGVNVEGGALSELARDAFQMPRGIIPRMAIMAAGHEGRNDPFKSPTDFAWWSKPYRVDLWTNLATYASVGGDALVDFDEDIANQSEVAITRALGVVNSYLATIRDAGWSHCAPYIVPTKPRKGQWPTVNATCVRIPDKADPAPIITRRSGFPWWLLLVAVALSRRKK